jgi:hypothetical protein
MSAIAFYLAIPGCPRCLQRIPEPSGFPNLKQSRWVPGSPAMKPQAPRNDDKQVARDRHDEGATITDGADIWTSIRFAGACHADPSRN